LVGGLICDLKKGFGCVVYDILLLKMEFYGTIAFAHKLMESYLRNRYQRVIINAWNKLNGYFSKWEEVQHGVPQGTWIIFPRVCRINPRQFYLLMTKALLLITAIRTDLNLTLTRYLMK